MTLDRTSWNTLWVSYLEELSRPVMELWRPYYRQFANTLGTSSSLRSLAGEWVSSYHSFQRDQLTDIPSRLDFEYDDVAESAGPRSAPLPPGWDPADRITVAPQGTSIALDSRNVMTRVENGRLTVSLVDLGTYHPRSSRLARPGDSGTYRLQSANGAEVTITTTHVPNR
jgi:hypothetical protein